jgi:hypothetical protein
LGKKEGAILEISSADLIEASAPDLTGDVIQIRRTWLNNLTELKRAAGKLRVMRLPFSVKTPEMQGAKIKLPKEAGEESFPTYLARPDVKSAVLARVRQSNGEIELTDVSPLQAVQAIGSDVVGITSSQIRIRWTVATNQERTVQGKVRRESNAFQIKPSDSQTSVHKLPAKVGNETFPGYLRRSDVHTIIFLRLGKASAGDVYELRAIEVGDALADDIEGLPKNEILSIWRANSYQMRKEKGTVSSRAISFAVRPPELQRWEYNLSDPKPGETLSSYLRRNDVQMTIASRAGNDSALRLTPTEVVTLIGPDMIQVTSIQITNVWARLITDQRKRNESSSVKIPATAQTWPRSETMKKELPRIEFLYRAVAMKILRRLDQDPVLEVFLVGRDADDFLIYTLALAEKNAPHLITRIKRLLMSNRLLMTDPSNPSLMARYSLDDIRKVLKHQGLSAEDFLSRRILLFDVGFDGHVMRPILAALLEVSKLKPSQFAKRVSAEFLISRPESPVALIKYKVEDGLEYKELRELQIKKNVFRVWEEMDPAYDLNPAGTLLRYLRVWGTMQILEFPLSEAFQDLMNANGNSRRQVIEMWDSDDRKLLSDPVAFRDWLESYVEGKGNHFVANVEENDVFRRDLARERGRLKDYIFGQKKRPIIEFEIESKKEAEIDPFSERARHEWLCKKALEGAAFGD